MTSIFIEANRMSGGRLDQNTVDRKLRAEQAEKADKPKDNAAPAPAADTLELSAAARPDTSGEVPFDRAKVDAIKQAIERGQYPLDARRMAESFLAVEQMINEK